MTIKKVALTFKAMSSRSLNKISKIILHHADAVMCSVENIHRWHLDNGWSGIGYHFFVRKNGDVYEGRPLNTVGSHAGNNNSDSVGICFEGDYDEADTVMPEAQFKSGQELIAYINEKVGKTLKIQRHKDVNSTACPGRYFPFEALINGKSTTRPVQSKSYSLLKKGSKGQDVRNLQTELNKKGAKLDVDGDFGSLTETAVKAFQSKNGLIVDGIVGEKTWASLNKDTVSSFPLLKKGNKGADVRKLQEILNKKGARLKIDGDFGKLTESAVRAFQKKNGLKLVDGIVGQETWGKLNK